MWSRPAWRSCSIAARRTRGRPGRADFPGAEPASSATGRPWIQFRHDCAQTLATRASSVVRRPRWRGPVAANLAQQRLEPAANRRGARVSRAAPTNAFGSLLGLPHARPVGRGLFANRGQFRRPGRRTEDPGGRVGDRPRDYRQPGRTGRRAATIASWPSTAAAKAMTTDQAANLLQGREGPRWRWWWRRPAKRRGDEHSPPAGRGPQRRQGARFSIRQQASAVCVDVLPKDYSPRPGRGPLATASRRHRSSDHRPARQSRRPADYLGEVVDLFVDRGRHRLDARPHRQEDYTYTAHAKVPGGCR